MHTDEAIRPQYEILATRFDRAAKLYDATYGPSDESGHGSPLLGWLRCKNLEMLRDLFPAGGAIIDIGCGTGEESLALVQAGYSVLGIDISPAMVRQAQTKAAVHGFRRGISFKVLPAGQIGKLEERGPFQGAFASQGVLNTEPDLAGLAKGLHDLLEPGAPLVAMVMSRHCLFEIWHNLRHLQPGETLKREPDWQETRAGSGGVVAPVKFYTPNEFAAPFEPYFGVASVQAFPLWLPPIHLHDLYRQNPARFKRLEQRWQRLRTWPGFRAWGDHFLLVLRNK
jgi:SAM-dependent methyltransferase